MGRLAFDDLLEDNNEEEDASDNDRSLSWPDDIWKEDDWDDGGGGGGCFNEICPCEDDDDDDSDSLTAGVFPMRCSFKEWKKRMITIFNLFSP